MSKKKKKKKKDNRRESKLSLDSIINLITAIINFIIALIYIDATK